MNPFTHFVGVDWSGAKGAHHKGLMIALCGSDEEAPQLVQPPSGHAYWSRIECGKWIAAGCGLPRSARILLGIDAAFGMPFLDEGTYFPTRANVPDSAPDLWAYIAEHCTASEDYFGGPFVDALSEHYHQHGGKRGGLYQRRMRMAEDYCRAARIGPCESVFNLVGASQVGKSALSTMIMLHHINQHSDVAVWPFENVDKASVCLVEIYAAVFSRLGQRRGKLKDLPTLNAALLNLKSRHYTMPLPSKPDDAADAIITAAGLRFIADDCKYWYPPQLSTKVRRTEGWIFGVV